MTDASGAVVPGATVHLTSASFDRSVTTDNQGFYRVLNVPPGLYTVATSATNFRAERRTNVEVLVGRTTRTDISLQVGGVAEEVNVIATDTAAIDPTGSRIQTNITDRNIELLPRGTNVTTVLQVNPATRAEPLSGGFSVDGASGSENTFIIDGQEVTNFRTGVLNINNNIPFQFVQEIQVKNSGYEAEFGGATGGVINIVTKRGANDFHGEIGTEFEVSRFFSRPRQILRATPTALAYLQPRRESFTNFFPSATLSGPIVRDRLWFFSSYTIQNLPSQRDFVFSDGTGLSYKTTDRRDYGFLRLDSQISDTLQLNASYTYNPLRRRGVLPATTTILASNSANSVAVGNRPAALADRGGRQPASNVSVSGVWTPTPNLVLSARAGRSYLNEKLANYGISTGLRTLCRGTGNASLPGVSDAGRCNAGFQTLSTNSLTVKDISIRKTFDVDGNFGADFAGRHQFKVGYQYNGLSNDVESGNVGRGTLVLDYGLTFDDANGNPRGAGPGEFGYGFLQQFGEFGSVSSRNEGIYIQDNYQPTQRLTLNLGVRFEKENVPPFNTGPGLQFGYFDKIAPRLGFAYDVTGSGNFKIFASYGQFFDRFKYELPRGSFGGNVFTNDYFVITNPNFNFYTFQNTIASSFLQLNFRVPANQLPEPITIPGLGTFTSLLEPDLKPVRQTEFTVGTEYGLGRDLLFGARYTRKQLDRTIEDVGIPDAGGNETYFIANPGFGLTSNSLIPGAPATPKAQRQYDAFEVRLEKRFSGNYYINTSYTLSRLYGNYGGLASADEDGRTAPNVTRAFDLPFESFTLNGEPNNGRLATDRPHVFKLFGGYTYNWFGKSNISTDFFGSTTVQSGTPLTTNVDILDIEVVAFRRGDLGRTEKFTQTDFGFSQKYRFGESENLVMSFDVNILNLFNEANELDRHTLLSTSIFGASVLTGTTGATRNQAIAAIFSGGVEDRVLAAINANNGALRDQRYNNTNLYQGPRQVRFGFRFQF